MTRSDDRDPLQLQLAIERYEATIAAAFPIMKDDAAAAADRLRAAEAVIAAQTAIDRLVKPPPSSPDGDCN